MENLVSIIVPVYNIEAYLEKCVHSIMKQSYKNIEIILVDDGSTDKSGEICDILASLDSRIIVIHQSNYGVSKARNVGIDNSSGKYVMFVDGDDELYTNAVEMLVFDMSHFDVDIVSGIKCTVDIDGNINKPYEDNKLEIYKGTEGLKIALENNLHTNSACAKLFKMSFLGDTRFVEGRKVNEDGFFMFQCFCKKPKFLQHNICVYLYFYRANSASRQCFNEKYLDMIYFCNRKKEIIEKDFPEFQKIIPNMEMRTYLSFLSVLCSTKNRKYEKYIKLSIRKVRDLYNDVDFSLLTVQQKKMAKLVYFHLFPIYKLLVYWKYYRKVSK